jgi:hypothetical protein
MILERFPKSRPPLPVELERVYAKHYKENRSGATTASSLSQKMEAWLHRQVARDVQTRPPKCTLEIGAGTLNQLAYELYAEPYDVVEPFKQLYEDSALVSRVRSFYSDISEVPKNSRYDRITSVATFEHICNLPEVVATAGLLLKPEGTLRVSIPSEGTFLWTLGWKLTTGLEFRLRYGLDYSILMRHEHVNTAKEVEAVLRHFFSRTRASVFGITKGLSLYQFYECSEPLTGRCMATAGSG